MTLHKKIDFASKIYLKVMKAAVRYDVRKAWSCCFKLFVAPITRRGFHVKSRFHDVVVCSMSGHGLANICCMIEAGCICLLSYCSFM